MTWLPLAVIGPTNFAPPQSVPHTRSTKAAVIRWHQGGFKMSDYLWYIHYLCVYALQARNFKEERGITLALWKSFYVMLERIVEIYIIYIEEWNMSNCIKEQKICQIFCTYYLLSDWTIHPLMEFCTVYYASFLCSKRRYH